MQANGDLLELLLEVQNLDRIPRMGYLLSGVSDPESVSEHTWHVAFLVWVLSESISDIDRLRAMEIAMVHDLAELRIGDFPRTASRYLPAGAKQAAEAAAIEEILAPLPAAMRALWAEYQAGESREARLVKACDKLQMMLKVRLYESQGDEGLKRFWDNPDNFPDGGFPLIERLFTELKERRSR
ncbi:MAG: HD domain-containing protein [Thermoanaerobaculia bacterium]|jgi:putative hydrolase of HD superfamily